jgi:hypothetical protein
MLYADTAETLWQQWVIDYNLEQQIDLVTRVERRSRSWDSTWFSDTSADLRQRAQRLAAPMLPYLPIAIAVALAAGLAALFAPQLWRKLQTRRDAARIARGQVFASDAAVLYGRMLDILRGSGVEKPPWLTPWEFARVVPESPRARIVDQITSAYHDLRYGGNVDAGRRMIQLLQELESTK